MIIVIARSRQHAAQLRTVTVEPHRAPLEWHVREPSKWLGTRSLHTSP